MKRLLSFGFVVPCLLSQPHCIRIHLRMTVPLYHGFGVGENIFGRYWPE
jgi:hypothetical protein